MLFIKKCVIINYVNGCTQCFHFVSKLQEINSNHSTINTTNIFITCATKPWNTNNYVNNINTINTWISWTCGSGLKYKNCHGKNEK